MVALLTFFLHVLYIAHTKYIYYILEKDSFEKILLSLCCSVVVLVCRYKHLYECIFIIC